MPQGWRGALERGPLSFVGEQMERNTRTKLGARVQARLPGDAAASHVKARAARPAQPSVPAQPLSFGRCARLSP